MGNPRTALGRLDNPLKARTVAAGIIGNTAFAPTIGLHPDTVKAIDGFTEFEPYLRSATNALETIWHGLEAIDKARAAASKNQVWNQWEKLLAIAPLARKKQEAMTRAVDTATRDLTKAAEQIEESLSKPLQARSLGVLNQEIRAHVRSLSSEERMKFINAAIKRGDEDALSSVLGVGPYLTGLGEAEHKMLVRRYNESRNPDDMRRLQATRSAIELLNQRSPLLWKQVEMAMGMAEDARPGSMWGLIDELNAGDKAARDALEMDSPTAA